MSDGQRSPQDVRDAGWAGAFAALSESHLALVAARAGVQALQDELARASRRLENVDRAGSRGDRPTQRAGAGGPGPSSAYRDTSAQVVDEARVELERTQAALLRSAGAAREAAPAVPQ